ncbi:hypothetical protein QA601_05840 [Chitinispirillales bacterium ANBcel5]|uniref:hypothetical protein n=1 Tax=Cellulosispirillum alkaliphilum TaxID=3039283 RepID=UPI002A518FD0|nr:hypothetical protein [Chitinispirillales bacterium ANBcel5]
MHTFTLVILLFLCSKIYAYEFLLLNPQNEQSYSFYQNNNELFNHLSIPRVKFGTIPVTMDYIGLIERSFNNSHYSVPLKVVLSTQTTNNRFGISIGYKRENRENVQHGHRSQSVFPPSPGGRRREDSTLFSAHKFSENVAKLGFELCNFKETNRYIAIASDLWWGRREGFKYDESRVVQKVSNDTYDSHTLNITTFNGHQTGGFRTKLGIFRHTHIPTIYSTIISSLQWSFDRWLPQYIENVRYQIENNYTYTQNYGSVKQFSGYNKTDFKVNIGSGWKSLNSNIDSYMSSIGGSNFSPSITFEGAMFEGKYQVKNEKRTTVNRWDTIWGLTEGSKKTRQVDCGLWTSLRFNMLKNIYVTIKSELRGEIVLSPLNSTQIRNENVVTTGFVNTLNDRLLYHLALTLPPLTTIIDKGTIQVPLNEWKVFLQLSFIADKG